MKTEQTNVQKYSSRSMLKWDLMGLTQVYDVTVKYNSEIKLFELFIDGNAFAVARDPSELYQIISSLNQFRLYNSSHNITNFHTKRYVEPNQ